MYTFYIAHVYLIQHITLIEYQKKDYQVVNRHEPQEVKGFFEKYAKCRY